MKKFALILLASILLIFTSGTFSSSVDAANSEGPNGCYFSKIGFKFPRVSGITFPDKQWYSYKGCNGYLYYSGFYDIETDHYLAYYSGQLVYAPIAPNKVEDESEE